MPATDFPELLGRVRAGDEGAFAELWRRHQPMVLRYMRALTGDAADDVASETWIAVVRSLHRFSGDETNFRTWLMTIARHRAVDWGRSRQRDRTVLQDPGQLEASASTAPDAANLVIDALSATAAVALVVNTLPPLQAEAVLLRSVIGLDVSEVALVMNKRAGTVRVLTHRGLRRLEEHLARRQNAGLA